MTQNSSEEGAKRYYQAELGSGSGYYLDDVRGIASWGGRGAKMLRLSGSVEQHDFERLCENRHPGSGERLTARQRPGRTVGYDLTFNAPKSATLLYELGEDKAVLKAFNESVVETMDDIESDALTRVRIGGQYDNRQTANLTWAQFNHFTTRPVNGNLDPHLHAHVFTFNATYDTDESKWKAVQFREINRDMPYYEALFQSRFAAKLNKLGYESEPHGRYFEVKGVSRHSIERFSNRSAEIEQKAQELNLKTPEAKAKLGATTRADKGPAPTIESLRADWTSRLSETELYALKGAKATKSVRATSPTLEQALDETLADYFGRSAVANERRVVADTLAKNPGAYSELKVQVALANRSGIELTRHQGKNLLVSSEELKTELALVRYVRQGLNQHGPVAPRREVLKDYKPDVEEEEQEEEAQNESPSHRNERKGRDKLSNEQKSVVRHLLRSTNSVIAISGKAGTGKTRLMTTAVGELKRRDKSVVVLAPSAQASRGVLRDEGFRQADTVAKFLKDGKFQKQAKNGFIWVDEAGLLSNRDMKAVFDVAKQKNARVILSGDTAQHQAVGVGNPLSTLYRHTPLKPVSLHDIHRQEDEAYRQAVDDLAQGQTAEGLGKLDDAGHIREKTEERSHQEIAERYRELTNENQSVLVVTPTNREREALTKAIRDELESSGRLSSKAKTFTTYKDRHLSEKEKLLASSYETGDKIYFNSRLGRFKAGEVATVRLARDDRLGGKHLMVTKRDGVKIRLEKIRLTESDIRKISVVDAEKIELKKGDLIRFTRNANSLSRRWFTKNNYHRVNNGQVATIKSIRGNTIRLTNGLKIDARLGNFTHGYVFTSYASQGQTKDHVLVSQHGDSLGAATNAEQVYVSVSRGRQSVKIYTDDKARFMKAATRQSDPTTAIDRQEERHERIRVKKVKDWLHRYDNRERVNESGL